MTKEEWLNIGIQNGIVQPDVSEMITFRNAYKEWFNTKCKVNRGSTMDRIEVAYNRYYADSPFIEKCTTNITEGDIIGFITTAISTHGAITQKEYERIYQIVHSVLVYLRDTDRVSTRLYDWDMVKRNAPRSKILTHKKHESALSKTTIGKVLSCVIRDNIYPEKRSACLCLCLNFYLGLRIGELAALQFTDFDLQEKVVRISKSDSKVYQRNENGEKGALTYTTGDTKTEESHRKIPLLPEAVYIYELIVQHHKQHNYDVTYLVYDGADTIRIRSLDRTLRRLCALCEVTPFNSHAIRKTFATMLHHSNVPTRVISDLMGHSEISTTENSYILSFSDNYDMYYDYMQGGLNYN